jgi:hypothetical protein
MAEKEMSCFLNPGMELADKFCAIKSCQRLLAFMAAAAWKRLTFIGGCSAVHVPAVGGGLSLWKRRIYWVSSPAVRASADGWGEGFAACELGFTRDF